MAAKTCFVVMPIKQDGPDHDHFKALYEDILKPVLLGLGYDVIRSDEVQKSGAITKEIVLRLAQADLVLADLTDLNPNVFYELGVRHSLRGQGTIMVLDELRGGDLPFDLSAYRVIKFKGELVGLSKLRNALISFIGALQKADPDYKDNAVHDWIPALPVNALQSSKQSTEGELREQLANAHRQIRQYEEVHGALKETTTSTTRSPLTLVMDVLAMANEGSLPSDLIQKAESAASKRDKKEFLNIVRRVMEQGAAEFTTREFKELANHSDHLGLDSVTGAIYDHATALKPGDTDLRNSQLAFFAHSDDPKLHERARLGLLSDIGITITDEGVGMPDQLDKEAGALLGIALDAYHRDDLNDQALAITTPAVERFPDMTVVLRNHARALREAGHNEEALRFYQKAVLCPDADDTSAIWFGHQLHNSSRHVDAVEAYLCACLTDPDDAAGFAHVAEDLSIAIRDQMTGSPAQGRRPLPDSLSLDTIADAIAAASSCNLLREDDIARCNRSARRLDIHLSSIQNSAGGGNIEEDLAITQKRMTLQQRVTFAIALYGAVRSDLTQPPTG